jgi:hypothetical protein
MPGDGFEPRDGVTLGLERGVVEAHVEALRWNCARGSAALRPGAGRRLALADPVVMSLPLAIVAV